MHYSKKITKLKGAHILELRFASRKSMLQPICTGFAARSFRKCGCFGRYLMIKFWEIFHSNASPWFMPSSKFLSYSVYYRLKNHPESESFEKSNCSCKGISYIFELGGHVGLLSGYCGWWNIITLICLLVSYHYLI